MQSLLLIYTVYIYCQQSIVKTKGLVCTSSKYFFKLISKHFMFLYQFKWYCFLHFNFHFFISSLQKYNRFLYIDIKLTHCSLKPFVQILQKFRQSCNLQRKMVLYFLHFGSEFSWQDGLKSSWISVVEFIENFCFYKDCFCPLKSWDYWFLLRPLPLSSVIASTILHSFSWESWWCCSVSETHYNFKVCYLILRQSRGIKTPIIYLLFKRTCPLLDLSSKTTSYWFKRNPLKVCFQTKFI